MRLKAKTGQNAIEYLLLLALVVGIVLVFLRVEMPNMVNAANGYFTQASNAIVGDPARDCCEDFVCSPLEADAECCTGLLPGTC